MENIDDQKIGEIKIYEGNIFFIVSQHIHKLLFLASKVSYDQYQKRLSEIGNASKSYAKKKVQEFLRNLSEVLCVASLSEEVINDIYTSKFFKDSSLSINFETLNSEDVYKRYQSLDKKVQHKKRRGNNHFSDPHEFCFICETEGEFIYVAIFV